MQVGHERDHYVWYSKQVQFLHILENLEFYTPLWLQVDVRLIFEEFAEYEVSTCII